jgi:hypothetical protein
MTRPGKVWAGVSLLLLLIGGGAGLGGYLFMDAGPKAAVLSTASVEAAPQEADWAKIKQLCSYCHEAPKPDLYPKYHWREEIKRAFDFLRKSDIRTDHYPGLESVILYYENRAPAEYPPMEKLPPAATPFACTFKAEKFTPSGLNAKHPGVTNVDLVNLFDDKKKDILICHTRPGEIWALQPYLERPVWRLLAKCVAPVHAEVVDLDGDGHKDLVVADIGSLFPSDARAGRVLWFKGDGKGNFAAPVTLLDGVGRTADVKAANFMGHADGKLDLIVAVFGWHTTGEIRLLENQTTDWTKPKFVSRILDERSGTIHVPVIDLDGDGRPDFIACISQETERIVAFLNKGNGNFKKEDIYVAPHPGWGFSGIQLADMNNDGKTDVLFSNGDILDPPYVMKPFHGVQWLENPGKNKDGKLTFPWKLHRIDGMNGTMRAVAADLDGNGLVDVVAVSFMPPERFAQRSSERMDSVIILSQTAPGVFERHSLETITADHLTCAVGDLRGTGRMDVVVGNFFLTPVLNQLTDSLTIWWNEGKKDGKK